MRILIVFIVVFTFSSCTYLITGYSNNCTKLSLENKSVATAKKTSIKVIPYNKKHFDLLSKKDEPIEDKYLQPVQIIYILDEKLSFFYNCKPYGITKTVEESLVKINDRNKNIKCKNIALDFGSEDVVYKLYVMYSEQNDHTLIFINTSFRNYYRFFIKDLSKIISKYDLDSSRMKIIFIDELFCEMYSK